jgi:hypothetical protein
MGRPDDWVYMARILDAQRLNYDAFLVRCMGESAILGRGSSCLPVAFISYCGAGWVLRSFWLGPACN